MGLGILPALPGFSQPAGRRPRQAGCVAWPLAIWNRTAVVRAAADTAAVDRGPPSAARLRVQWEGQIPLLLWLSPLVAPDQRLQLRAHSAVARCVLLGAVDAPAGRGPWPSFGIAQLMCEWPPPSRWPTALPPQQAFGHSGKGVSPLLFLLARPMASRAIGDSLGLTPWPHVSCC